MKKYSLIVGLGIAVVSLFSVVQSTSAQSTPIRCNEPGQYFQSNSNMVLQPTTPNGTETVTTYANFTFPITPNTFIDECVNKPGYTYKIKFVYSNYGGTKESIKSAAKTNGYTLRASDTQTWATLTAGQRATGTNVTVRAYLFAVGSDGTEYQNGVADVSGQLSFTGVTLNSGGDTGGGTGGGGQQGGGNQNGQTNLGGSSANNSSADVGKSFYNPIGVDNIPAFIVRVIQILLFLTGMLAVLFIIIGGVRYIASQGNSQATTTAKNTILYAILGLTFSVLSYAIVNVITNVLINK